MHFSGKSTNFEHWFIYHIFIIRVYKGVLFLIFLLFWNVEIANITINELFDNFIFEIFFSLFINYFNSQNI